MTEAGIAGVTALIPSVEGRPDIVVVGLGYVGLPLAVALADNFKVAGLDSDAGRIAELARGHDRTNEVDPERLARSTLELAVNGEAGRGAALYILTVPTPVDRSNQPDLGPLLAASRTVAGLIDPQRMATIVFESTVYPGVSEEICGPEIERASGLRRGVHFRLGYSPERINPGDRVHRIDRIVKVIAGEDQATTDLLAHVYGSITSGGVYRAASIKAAEAAKVIENAQRDINIAFINEMAQIFARLDLSVWDVLDVARTKWNFLPFEPGLVGGHCIGVDPYYLSARAQQLGFHPRVILAGRDTNDGMGAWVGDALHRHRRERPGSALIMGLTFKENVPDLRNSRVVDLVRTLERHGHQVTVIDPLADPAEAASEHGLAILREASQRFDLVVGAVAHDSYRELDGAALEALVEPGGTLADLKNIWHNLILDPSIDRWRL